MLHDTSDRSCFLMRPILRGKWSEKRNINGSQELWLKQMDAAPTFGTMRLKVGELLKW